MCVLYSLKDEFPFLSYYITILSFLYFANDDESVVQSTPDNSNLQGKSKKVRVSGSLSSREYEANNRKGGNGMGNECK